MADTSDKTDEGSETAASAPDTAIGTAPRWLLGALIGIAALAVVWPAILDSMGDGSDEETTAQEARLTELAQAIEGDRSAADGAQKALSARLDALEARPEPTPDADLPALKESASVLRAEVDALQQKLDALASAPAPEPVDDGRIGTALDRIALLDAELAHLTKRMDELEARPVADPMPVDDTPALILALDVLKQRATSGRPFRAELDTLADLAADKAGSLLGRLEAHADAGVATVNALARRLSEQASDILAAERAAAAEDWVDQALAWLSTLVSWRPTGSPEGDDAGPRLARAESLLAAGNLAGAVEEVDALEGAAAAAAAAWREAASARLAVERTLAEVRANLLGGLAGEAADTEGADQ